MKTTELLHMKQIAVKNMRTDLFKIVRNHKSVVVTRDGKPEMVMFPYADMIELVEILEESKDAALREEIRRARDEYRSGGGVPYQE